LLLFNCYIKHDPAKPATANTTQLFPKTKLKLTALALKYF